MVIWVIKCIIYLMETLADIEYLWFKVLILLRKGIDKISGHFWNFGRS